MEERKTHSGREGELVKRTSESRQKRAYIEELVRSRGIGAVPLLAELLGNESWTLRENAALALSAMGRGVVPTVLPLARSGLWYCRAGVARVLGAVAGPESIEVLMEMLAEDNRTVRSAGAEALAHICRRGGAAAVGRRLVPQRPEQRETALRTLEASEAGLSEKLRRLMADQQLMTVAEDDDEAWEESPEARARAGQGLVWEVLTGAKPTQPPPKS